MALYFNDLYVQTVAKGLLVPGEQLLHRVSAAHSPWWAMGMPMFKSQYLVLATNQRLVLIRHKRGWITGDRMESVESVQWNAVQKVKVKGLFAQKSMTIQGNGGQVSLGLKLRGGMFELPKNVDDAKSIESMRALPS